MTTLAFFGQDARDAAVQRRIAALTHAGADVTAFTMRRGVAFATPWRNVDLGETKDAAFVQRLGALARARPILRDHRDALNRARVFYARNLDMLALAHWARRMSGADARLVYECLDVHRFLTRPDVLGAGLRALERRLLLDTDRVIISSPAFAREYFDKRHPGFARTTLIENRLPWGFDYGPRTQGGAPGEGKLRIGWFGNLRCARSFALLTSLARAFPDRVQIVMRGAPSPVCLPNFERDIAGVSNVTFGGRYAWPDDLGPIYGGVDLVWAGDFHDASANSKWLLPNRIYEGGYYGTPPVAPANSETGRWVGEHQFGFVLDEPIEQTLPDFIRHVSSGEIADKRARLLAAPDTLFLQPRDELRIVFEARPASRRAFGATRPVILMLLTRHPYREKSGRGFMLRQRIEQLRRRFDTRIVVFDRAANDGSDQGLIFAPLANLSSIALNGFRLSGLPLQTWLYFSSSTRRQVAGLARAVGASAVYVDMLRLAPLAQRLREHVAVIVDFDDLLSERYRTAARDNYDLMGFLSDRVGPLAVVARLLAKPLLAWEAARCAEYEKQLLKRCDLALFTSPREAEAMKIDGAHVLAAPPLIAPRIGAGAIGRRLIFLGNLRYAENIEMLRTLAAAAAAMAARGGWPSDATIEAVGDHSPDLPAKFDPRHFRFLGRVDDLTMLAGEGVFLAPVTTGSGVKLKVLDGLSLGCPVVATSKACEGLAVRPNRDLLVAGSAEETLRIALALRDRTRLKAMLAVRGRAYLVRTHGIERGEEVAGAIASAIARTARLQPTQSPQRETAERQDTL
ncbi:MAG: glycosyltransferase [Hyphomonadaceae bacterium]|nr:glycosyltransferase [Hyphomonadaceae bacterium]